MQTCEQIYARLGGETSGHAAASAYLATRPVVDAFNALGNLVLKPFGIPPAREVGHAPHTEGELRLLVRESQAAGADRPEEGRFAENVSPSATGARERSWSRAPRFDFADPVETLSQGRG